MSGFKKFKIKNRSSENVQEKINIFENNLLSHQIFSVEFFEGDDEQSSLEDENDEQSSLEDENDEQSSLEDEEINEYDKMSYINFLEKNANRIRSITINISENEMLPYSLLGDFLSKLTHIETIIIKCTDELANFEVSSFGILGRALNKLAGFEYLKSLQLDIKQLGIDNEVESTADIQQFIYFLQSCYNIENFQLKSNWLDYKTVISRMLDEVVKYPYIKTIELSIMDYELPNLRKLFTIKSLENLSIELTGVIEPFDKDAIWDQMNIFASQLKKITGLKTLKLNFHEISNFVDDIFSIKSLFNISHNKSLQSLHIEIPHTNNIIQDEQRDLIQFVNNFRNSNMTDLKIFNGNREVLSDLTHDVTNENKLLNQKLENMQKMIYKERTFYKDSIFYTINPEEIRKLDERLSQYSLSLTHLELQKSQRLQLFVPLNFEIFRYVCHKIFEMIAKSPQDAQFAIQMMPYISQKDFANLLGTCKGIREPLKEFDKIFQKEDLSSNSLLTKRKYN